MNHASLISGAVAELGALVTAYEQKQNQDLVRGLGTAEEHGLRNRQNAGVIQNPFAVRKDFHWFQ